MYRYFLYLIFLPILLIANEHLEKISLQLSWFNQFQFAGYYIAKEKGFYEDYGLDVDIKYFNFNIDVVKDVNENKSDFGIARETLIPERINNYNNLVALYALFQISPLVLISKKDSNINEIKEFYNKRIMLTDNDYIQASIKALLIANKVDLDSIKFLKHTHNVNDLVNNNTDIISAYISKTPYFLEKNHIPFNIFSPKDLGFDFYSDFLFTNKTLIKKDEDKVIAFKKASLLGWQYAFNNIEESVDIILKKYNSQNLTKDELIYEANALKKLSYYKNNPLGDIDENKLKRIYDIYYLMGYIKNSTYPSDLVFDEYKPIFSEYEKEFLKDKDTFKMCVRKNFLPYEAIIDGNIIGINSEYLRIFEKKIGKSITLVPVNTLKESISKLKNYECDFFSFFDESNIEDKDILFTKSYMELPFVLVTTGKDSFITNFEQLKNKKIFVENNINLFQTLKRNYPYIHLYTTYNPSYAFKKISENNSDGYLGNIANVVYNLQKEYNTDVNITGNFDYKTNILLAMNTNNFLLQNILNKVISNISKEEKELILNNYTLLKYKEVKNYKTLFIVLISSFLVISLLTIVYVRESILKNKIQKLNENLEKRVLEESLKNRKKDEMLFKQTKLAAMGEMINNIAHQWRQPLNRINLSVQIIENILKENKNLLEQQDLNIIDKKILHVNKNIIYMSNTIEDFMNFFHPNKEKNLFNLSKLIMKAIILIQSKDSDIYFEINVDKKINIFNFENELLQVILVILENAIDNFELNSSKNKYLGIFAKKEKKKITLTIRDNSGGIPSSIIDKIFEPYFTTKFKKEGSGIGLYMAKILIEQSIGGKLDVNSDNSFTNFIITLPKENE